MTIKRMIAVFLGCCVCFAVYSAGVKPFDQIRDTGKLPVPPAVPKGELLIYPLDNQHLVVVGNYREFLNSQIIAAYGPRLKLNDKYLLAGQQRVYSDRFFYNFAAIDILAQYHPQIRDRFERSDSFAVTVNGKPAEIAANGSWINAVGLLRVPRQGMPGEMMVRGGDLAHFAYLKLAGKLSNGDRVVVRTPAGEEAQLTFDDKSAISRAIKVDQVGYLPDAGGKYAYLGMWMGSLGELPVTQFAGKEFHLRRESDGEIAFTGKIAPRKEEQFVERNGYRMPLYGETVMEMDFSEFSEPGRYYLQVPGVGRSWGFLIGPDAVGRSFYIHMRGLFHQRSGIAKPPDLTGWPIGRDHPTSYRGGFAPNDRHYGSGAIAGPDGKPELKLKQFDMVRATATDEELKDVYGGWWDAGDFDRRTYHFQIVDSLLSVYLLMPENFSDRQLDIPESGNGVPDIIDEAAWGVDVWRRAQNEAGGVGCWLEATSHPENPDPVKDVQRYYLALPTRESTLEYSIYAAKLARAYEKCGRLELAKPFRESALKAWDYALNPANRVVKKFTIPKRGEFTYTEPEELPEANLFKAALNLYLLTRDSAKFQTYLDDKKLFDAALNTSRRERGAFYLSELAENKFEFFTHSSAYRMMVRKEADAFIASSEEQAYRNIGLPLSSPYFTFLGWGQGLPPRRASFLVMAWLTDGRKKYRDVALQQLDWMQGANPMGRSLTTGLGEVYPIRLLSLPNWGMFLDPIPGITLYTFTGRTNYSATSMIFSINEKPREDHKFEGASAALLPHSVYSGPAADLKAINETLYTKIPIWRRFANLEGYAVDQNEYSVWETIGPAAALSGALLQPGWTPPPDWKKQQPKKNYNDLPGYLFLP